MLESIGRIMLYVDNTQEMMNFWVNTVGFTLIETGVGPFDTSFYVIAPNEFAQTQLVLFNKSAIEKTGSLLDLALPSLLFSTSAIQQTYDSFKQKNIPTGEIVEIQGMVTFNFSDPENNWYAVREVKV